MKARHASSRPRDSHLVIRAFGSLASCSVGAVLPELAGEGLARDRAQVEPYPVAPVDRLLGADVDAQSRLRLQCARLTVHRHDGEAIARVRLRGVVAPQKALDRRVLRAETGGLRRIVRATGVLGVRDDGLEDLQRAQPLFTRIGGAHHRAFEAEAHQAVPGLLGAVQRDQHRVRAGDRSDLEMPHGHRPVLA
jgi:hypothetical protein